MEIVFEMHQTLSAKRNTMTNQIGWCIPIVISIVVEGLNRKCNRPTSILSSGECIADDVLKQSRVSNVNRIMRLFSPSLRV